MMTEKTIPAHPSAGRGRSCITSIIDRHPTSGMNVNCPSPPKLVAVSSFMPYSKVCASCSAPRRARTLRPLVAFVCKLRHFSQHLPVEQRVRGGYRASALLGCYVQLTAGASSCASRLLPQLFGGFTWCARTYVHMYVEWALSFMSNTVACPFPPRRQKQKLQKNKNKTYHCMEYRRYKSTEESRL